MNWMKRLKRIIHIDIEHRPAWRGTCRATWCIEAPGPINRILVHVAARIAIHRSKPNWRIRSVRVRMLERVGHALDTRR